MTTNRPQEDIDAEAFENNQLNSLAAKGAANAAWVEAIRSARRARTEAGLDCHFAPDGSAIFEADQGIKASCYTREDAAATLILQREILLRLDQLRKMGWWAIGILAVTALKVFV
jgi:hypothetical protein